MNKLAILASARCGGVMLEEKNSLEDYGITVNEHSIQVPNFCREDYQIYDNPAVCVPSFRIDNRHERRRLERKNKSNNRSHSNYTQPKKGKRKK